MDLLRLTIFLRNEHVGWVERQVSIMVKTIGTL